MALSVQTILERNRLFRGLSTAAVQQISSLVVRRFYQDGAIIFSQGDPGDALYGVTMAPGGSSQVISQKVEKEKEPA